MLILSVNIMCYTQATVRESVCQFKRLMIAQFYNQITNSNKVLLNCKCSDNCSYGNVVLCCVAYLLILDHLNTVLLFFYFVLYSYFLCYVLLYIQLQTVKCIDCIIKCNIVPFSYSALVMSLHIIYIPPNTLQYTLSILTTISLHFHSHSQMTPFQYA
jgi:hypothetical protein